MTAKNGGARIARLPGAPVIPGANWGTQDGLPPGTAVPKVFFPRRRRVTVVAGPPVDLARWMGGPRTRSALDGVTAAIMADVTALVAGVRGETPPAVAYDPAAIPALPAAGAARPARGG